MRAVLLWPGSMMRRYYCGGDLVSFLINLFRVVVMELLYTNVERFDNDYHKVARWCSSVKHDSSSDISPAPRVSDFNVSQSGLVDELEAFGCWHTLMVSISLIPAFIQDQRKQQGVCWEAQSYRIWLTPLFLAAAASLRGPPTRLEAAFLGGAPPVEDEEGGEGERVGGDWVAFYQVCCKPLACYHNIN